MCNHYRSHDIEHFHRPQSSLMPLIQTRNVNGEKRKVVEENQSLQLLELWPGDQIPGLHPPGHLSPQECSDRS